MKTNLIKRIITIVAAVTVTLAIGVGGACAQGSVPVPDYGIVKDGTLVWLKNANCFGRQKWDQANNSAAGLQSGMCGLKDGSTAGQWRLPTKDELLRRSKNMQGFINVQSYYYFSSTMDDSYGRLVVDVIKGTIGFGAYIGSDFYVWPVRSAP